MADLTFGLGLVGLGLVAAILIGVGMFGNKQIGKQAAKWFMAIGIVAALLCVVTYAGVADMGADDATVIPSAATYDVTVAEAEAEVFAYADQNKVVVAMSFNDTSNAFVGTTGAFSLNYTILRSDALTTDAIAAVSIGSVPSVDVTGAADEYIVDENADGTFNAAMLKSGAVTTYERATVLVEAGSSNWVNVTITLNAAAVAEMSQYEQVTIPLTVAGETWSIVCEKATVTA